MPFLTKKERDTFKSLLDDVMDDDSLASEFNKAQARKAGICGDYTDAMLGQYMGILKEIQDERAAYTPPKVDAVSPDIETLKKKYFGPKQP